MATKGGPTNDANFNGNTQSIGLRIKDTKIISYIYSHGYAYPTPSNLNYL